MRSYFSLQSTSTASLLLQATTDDQSRTPAVTTLPHLAARCALKSVLWRRLGRMEGRSVRWMEDAGIRAEAARPTRPVPAPSSRIRGRGDGDGGVVVVE